MPPRTSMTRQIGHRRSRVDPRPRAVHLIAMLRVHRVEFDQPSHVMEGDICSGVPFGTACFGWLLDLVLTNDARMPSPSYRR